MKKIDICDLMEYELKKFKYLKYKRDLQAFYILTFDNDLILSFFLRDNKVFTTALIIINKKNKEQYEILKSNKIL